MRLISTIKKYYQDDNQILTTFSFLENIFSVNARKILFTSILFFAISFANAATITSTTMGGTWSATTTWAGGILPGAGDNVIIATTGANSVTLGANATIVNVTINAGAVLNGNFTLIITGNFTNSGIFTSGGEVRLTGTANQNIQGFTTTGLVSMRKTGGTATFTGNVKGAGLTINGNGGTLNLGIGLSHTFTGVVTLKAGTLNGGSSTINVNSVSTTAWNGTGSLFVPATSTVNFGANGDQTISASSPAFYNLTFSFSGIKSLPSSNIINGTLSMEGIATVPVSPALTIPNYGPTATLRYNRVSVVLVGQEWKSPFNSTGGVTITNIGAIKLNAAKVLSLSNPLTINSGATLDTNNFGMTFGGNFVNSGTFTAGSSLISITNTMATQTIAGFTTTGLVSMTKTSGTATFTSAVNGVGLTLNGAGGTLNLGTGLSHTFAGDVALTGGALNGGSSILNLNSASTTVWTGTGTNFSAGTGTVIFGGTAQTLAAASTFNNLIFSNSGLKTLTGVPTITGILSMEGTATVSVAPVYGTAATLQYNRLVSQVTGSEWINIFAATGGVKISNTGTITINSAKAFNATVPLTIITGATLDNGGSAITGGGTLTVASGGALKLGGTTVFPTFATPTLDAVSTIEYSGTAQAVAIKNYGNLILSGSGNKTFSGATTIVGNLGINGTAAAILPTGSVSSTYTFTINGLMQAIGSWGGSTSAATFQDATRFGSTTTGTLNSTNSCVFGYWLGTVNTDWNVAGNWCGGIPNATTNIVIPSAPTRQPVIGGASLCKNITINSGATLTISSSDTLTITGNWTNNGTFTANTSTVNFNGAVGQSIGGSSTTTFNDLTNSNLANTVTAQLGIIVKNILNISNSVSVLDMSTYRLTDGGAFSNAGPGLLRTSNISTTPIPAGKTWSNSVNYNNLTGGQTIVVGNYNGTASLDLGNTSGTQRASGDISIGNQLIIDNGGTPTFTLAGFNLNTAILKINTAGAIMDVGIGNLSYSTLESMNGKIRFSGASNGLAIPTGTVEYYGGTQTVASGTYSNLLFSGVSGNYTITSDLNCNNSFIINDGNVDVQDSVSLTANCALTVVAPGTLTFENNASLVQTGYTGANVGNITVKRYSTPIILDDFTYWSSPTSGTQTLYNFSPNTQGDKFFEYNNDWANVNASSTSFTRGIGYAIRSPESASTVTATIDTSFKFIGTPNNGKIDIPVTIRTSDGLGERLIGNPYPSAIDAEAFINANIIPGVTNPSGGTINQTITGTLYFWTHNHSLTKNNGNDYNGDDYATFNLTGGSNLLNGTGNNIEPDGFIAAGQGFFVENDFAGKITFDNTMRLNNNNANFYKVKSIKALEKHRIWLNLSNNTINGSQTVVGYVENATNDYDPGYDSYVYDDKQLFSIYSLIGADKMVIQGRALPFVDTDKVYLGYAINAAGNATISIDHVDGLFDDTQNIYIEDKLLNVIHDIKTAPYNFSSAVGTFNDRFVLRYTDKTLGTATFDLNDNSIVISKKGHELKIKSALENIKQITVFDLLGRKIFERSAINSAEFLVSQITLNNQIGVVKVVLVNGQEFSKKIVF